MKKYTIPRPSYTTYVQWDGTNIAEFEALTGEDWPYLWWTPVTFFDNGGSLEIYRSSDNFLVETIPNGYWSCGPGSVLENVESTSTEQVIDSPPPFNYTVAE